MFPPLCPGCGKKLDYWCPECQAATQWIQLPICRTCGDPLRNSEPCFICSHISTAFTQARSVAVYEEPFSRVVRYLKYHGNAGLGITLAQPLIWFLKESDWLFDMVVPVPLGERRIRERGYNQAVYLSRPIAQYFNKPFIPNILKRVRETRSQVELTPHERRQNVQGAFAVMESHFVGKTILLIDDVTTTGATLNACALALVQSGASDVFALTLARPIGTE